MSLFLQLTGITLFNPEFWKWLQEKLVFVVQSFPEESGEAHLCAGRSYENEYETLLLTPE